MNSIENVFTSNELIELEKFFLEEVTWKFDFSTKPAPEYLFKLDYYINQRNLQRNPKWRSELSKKEIVLCKINLLKDVMLYVNQVNVKSTTTDQANYHEIIDIINNCLKLISNEIFSYDTLKTKPASPEDTLMLSYYEPWPGLGERSANLLNALYKSLLSSYNQI